MDKLVKMEQEQSASLAHDTRSFRRYKKLSKEILEDMYINQKLSTVDMSKLLNIARRTLSEYMDLYNIPRRSPLDGGMQKSKLYTYDSQFFSKIDTHDKAYILGFINGDGHIAQRKKGGYRIQLSIAEEDGHLLQSISSIVYGEDISKSVKVNHATWQNKRTITFNCSQMSRDLIKLGVMPINKTDNEQFIRLQTNEYTWSFIRGMFDADGHIGFHKNKKRKFLFTTGIPFILGFKKFLIEHGCLIPQKAISVTPGTHRFALSGKVNLRLIRDNMYANGSLYLSRKKEVFDRVVI